MAEEVLREGTWTCPNCDTKNRGRELKCKSGCGQSREGVEFDFDENEEVTDAEGVAIAEAGADWICGYCSTSNRATTPKCSQCGGALDEGKAREQVTTVYPDPEESPQPQAQALAGAAASDSGIGSTIGKVLKWGAMGFAALFVFLIALGSCTHEEKLTLSSAYWSRNIAIEKFVPVDETAWEGEVPAGARVQGSSSEIHHHDRIPDGTESYEEHYTVQVQSGTRRVKTGSKTLGNGFRKDTYEQKPVYKSEDRTRHATRTRYRSVPVFRRKYRYEIDRWKPFRDVKTSGGDTTMKWGEVALAPKEREGARTEGCKVTFTGKKGNYEWKPTVSEFGKLTVGKVYKVEVDGLGSVNKLLE